MGKPWRSKQRRNYNRTIKLKRAAALIAKRAAAASAKHREQVVHDRLERTQHRVPPRFDDEPERQGTTAQDVVFHGRSQSNAFAALHATLDAYFAHLGLEQKMDAIRSIVINSRGK